VVVSTIDGQYLMKRRWIITLAATAVAATAATAGHAEPNGLDKAKTDAFDVRMFAGVPGQKAYACFVRSYDRNHLAQHPNQKVSAMKLLVTSEIPSDANTYNYSFRLGVRYGRRPGNFDSSGDCGHVVAEDTADEIRLGCGVDCEGGGIEVALSKDDKSAIVRLKEIRIWPHNKPDIETAHTLVAGADDGIFRLDRADSSECTPLVQDRDELAALRHSGHSAMSR
jgi:hypothetical protein